MEISDKLKKQIKEKCSEYYNDDVFSCYHVNCKQ